MDLWLQYNNRRSLLRTSDAMCHMYSDWTLTNGLCPGVEQDVT